MHMGLKYTPSFFEKMNEDVLFTAYLELCAFVSVYIDHKIIAIEWEGLTEEQLVAPNERQLNRVMDILDANKLSCGLNKRNCF